MKELCVFVFELTRAELSRQEKKLLVDSAYRKIICHTAQKNSLFKAVKDEKITKMTEWTASVEVSVAPGLQMAAKAKRRSAARPIR
jgi:hypothetical protein